MFFFYQFYAGMPEVDKLVGSCNLMAIRFESCGQNELVDFWSKCMDLDREAGTMVSDELKTLRVYAGMSKVKQFKEEMIAYDKLDEGKRGHHALFTFSSEKPSVSFTK